MKCAETERPCLGEQRGNSFVLSKKKKERKEKKNNLEWWLKKKERSAKPSCSVDFPFLKFFTVSFVESVYFLFVYPSLVYLKWVQISTWLFTQIW